MDESIGDKIDWMFANLMVFYKGGLSYTELNNMPLPLVIKYYEYGEKMNKEAERKANAKR